MSIIKPALFAATMLFTAGVAHADPAGIEIKGLRIGMSEAEFKKLNRTAKCGFSSRDVAWDSSISRVRTCSVADFTLATKEAERSQFLFYEDKLGSWNATFYDFYGSDLREALAAKFGSPLADPQGASWVFGGTSMHLVMTGGSALLVVQSDISSNWNRRLQEFKLRKGKADL